MAASSRPVPLEDVLADVLATTRVGGVLTVQAELSAPWGIAFPTGPVAAFHVVVDGGCFLRTPGEPPSRLHPGDVVLFAGGAEHTLASDSSGPAVHFSALRCHAAAGVPVLRFGGGGLASTLLCGLYRFERDLPHPVLSLLPLVLRTSAAGTPVAVVLDMLRREVAVRPPGVRAALTHLVDLLFLYLVREWLDRQPEGHGGWLGALRDPLVGRVLALLHLAPERRWTVDDLASEAGASRSTLARRFVSLVGQPPLSYLANLRMRRAAHLLRETDRPLSDIASGIGYESVYAFNRAFRRNLGLSPGRFRARG